MGKTKGSSKAAISHRQETVLQYWIRGVGPDAISKTLHVDRHTIQRDIKTIETQLSRRVEMVQLYTVQKAFAELQEAWREAWILFHRPKDKQTVRLGGENVQIEVDDSFRKMQALDHIRKITQLRCKLAGYFAPKFVERITMLETIQGHGIQIERLTFEEQLSRGMEELQGNEGLRRSEGLLTDQDPQD